MADTPGKTEGAQLLYKSGSVEDRFLKAFDEYGDALFRHAMFRISDREKAIDLVHDTYVKVWSYIKSGHEVASFRPFLYKVLNNLIIDEYRKHKEASLDALLEEDLDEGMFDDLQDHSMKSLLDQLDGARALKVVEQLPDTYKEVLIFRFVDGLRPSEICDLVEESENTVSVRIHRGLNMLRKLLESQDEIAEVKRNAHKK